MIRKIKDFENYYISSNGFVYCRRKKTKKLKELYTIKNSKHSYIKFNIRKNKKSVGKLLHRLIAEHFIPNPNNFNEVNHIDGNKLNNNVNNLEWCSREMNMKYAVKTKLIGGHKWKSESKKNLIKSRIEKLNGSPRSKLTKEQVLEIRYRYDNGEKASKICLDFPINRVATSRVGKRETYGHI